MRLTRLHKKTSMIRSAFSRIIENLEQRRLLTAVLLEDGILDVTGTSGNDVLNVKKVIVNDVAKLKVYENGSGGRTISWFALADVNGLRMSGLEGDDQIILDYGKDGLIDLPASLIGGTGDDSLKGGAGNDQLIGGEGWDYLYGESGDDVLIGNSGIDYIFPGEETNEVYSGAGADRIMSVSDQDTYPKGEGKDTFEETARHDFTVYDYTDSPAGLTPQQVRAAYFVGDLTNSSFTLKGKGQAIAIVDAFHTPTARKDLTLFCEEFGLSTPTKATFKQVHAGKKTPIVDEGWSGEALLDIEWVHAIAPEATIILVEAKSAFSGDLYTAVDYASDYLNKHTAGV
jgi:hypothetical protein